MPKRGYDDDHEMRDDRGGKSFRDDGGACRSAGTMTTTRCGTIGGASLFGMTGGSAGTRAGTSPGGPATPTGPTLSGTSTKRHEHEEWMLKGYDPKTIERALKKRALEAQQALERFVSHCQGHALEAPAQFFEDWGRAAMDTEDGK